MTMKLWVWVVVALVVVSIVEARRGGRRKEWRRQKYDKLRAERQGSEIGETSENMIKDNDDDIQTNDWSAKKRGKWPMQHQRRREWMDKRRGMMYLGDGPLNAEETDTDDPEVIKKEKKHPMMYRRKWHNKEANDDERSQNRGDKKKKWHHKKHENGRSCICHLEPEQKEKLRELIMKEGLEKEFPQIVPPEGDTDGDDVIQITNEISDVVV